MLFIFVMLFIVLLFIAVNLFYESHSKLYRFFPQQSAGTYGLLSLIIDSTRLIMLISLFSSSFSH